MTAPTPSFAHLAALTDERGIFEHTEYGRIRREHGYCLDDAARALAVAVRQSDTSPVAARLAKVYAAFVDRAVGPDGRAHNRLSPSGRWIDRRGSGDWWGRAIQGLGVAATTTSDPELRARADAVFRRAARTESSSLRAMCFAALGASDVAVARPENPEARILVLKAVAKLTSARSVHWDWPEDRLRYANAAIPEALIAAGVALREDAFVQRGLALLEFLIDLETRGRHFSVTPTHGRGPGELAPGFDQQGIEVAAIAEACARAFEVTSDPRWVDGVGMAWAWFEGRNDVGAVMYDAETGAGYDGLTPTGRNENRGAESTLAALSTLQCLQRCGAASGTAALVSSGHGRSDGGRSMSSDGSAAS